MRTRRRAAIAAAGVTAALIVTGCGELPPGTASVVEGTSISDRQVRDLADAQCDGVELGAEQGEAQVVPRKQLTQRALGLLIDIRLNLAYGESLDLEPRPEQVKADFAQVKPLIQALPEKHHDYLEDVFSDWANGRDVVEQVGETTSGQSVDAANPEQALEAGYKERQSWLDKSDRIRTDSRYSPGEAGWPGEGDASVSRPVSSFAKAASSQEPSAGFLEDLPAGQRCG